MGEAGSPVGRLCPFGQPDKAEQNLVGGPDEAIHQHHRFGYARMGQQNLFNFRRFDALAVELDLVIDPARKLHQAVGSPAAKVAGAVKAALGSLNEPLGGQVWPVEIADAQSYAANPQLTRNAGRNRRSVAPTKRDSGVGQGPARRNRGCRRNIHGCKRQRCGNAGLGRAVAIPKGQVPGMVTHIVVGGSLAARHQNTQSLKRNMLGDAQVGRGVKGHRDALIAVVRL